MRAVLVSIEGAICDNRSRQHLSGTPDFYKREVVLKDMAVPDSVRCLRELAQKYKLVYTSARPPGVQALTEEWLQAKGFPKGPVSLAPSQAERLAHIKDIGSEFDFAAGIGAAWSDNELHLELGCQSLLLKEFEGNWDTVRRHLMGQEHTALQTAGTLLAPWAKATTSPEPHRMDVTLEAGDLPAAVTALHGAHWGYLSAITGMDHPGAPAKVTQAPAEAEPVEPASIVLATGTLEALYHFCSGAAVVTLRVSLPRECAAIPSICGIIPAASLFERELGEMFGITVTGTPNPDRLLLPDDWPDGVYPLRKDFDPQKAQPVQNPQTGRDDPADRLSEEGHRPGKFVVPIGPQHPALKEPGHFEFSVDGEMVTEASVRLGYVHRGIERACEERNWVQCLYLLERICGICSHHHAAAYCLGVERLAGVDAPPRAQAIRELAAGLERIHSHLLWLGVAAHEAGFDTLFMYSWRDRETVMDLLEGFSGNRVNYSVNVLGGVKFDIDDKQSSAMRQGLDFLEERTRYYLNVAITDQTFVRRTRGVGVLSQEMADELGVVGPMARASGLARDIRVEAPYGAYVDFPVNIVTETAGDLEAKFVVRLKEIFESITAIRNILDHLPPGDLTARMPRRIPEGETISRVEAPRGELFYFIKSNGSDKPERIKVRTPSLCNFTSAIALSTGHQLADIPLILAGIDPCFSCNDRAVIVNRRGSNPDRWTWEQLRQHGIERYRE